MSVRLIALVVVSLSSGCDAESRRCRELFNESQRAAHDVDSKSIESVRGAIQSLDAAVASCEAAKLGTTVLLFIVALKFLSVQPLPLFIAYIATLTPSRSARLTSSWG